MAKKSDSSKENIHPKFLEQIVTTFGPETDFDGDLTYESSLLIKGKFKGSIKTNGYLIIDKEAEVDADIEANTVFILGLVKGNVHASNKVEMLTPARIYGDVEAAKLKMADGVVLKGHLKHLKD